jgi:hypothetical protein
MTEALGQFATGLVLNILFTPVGFLIPAALLAYAGLRVWRGVRVRPAATSLDARPGKLLSRPLPRVVSFLVGMTIIIAVLYVLYLFSRGGFPGPDLTNFQG